ncbi:MAG TPA: hypothetical protein VG943_14255 [Caulobacterales bacterium]|nr:hypothetical protein [Caulobacterales bacterium]
MASGRAQATVNPLWLFPSAMTFVAFYQSIFEFGHLIVDLCGVWLAFCRELWARLFALAPGAHLQADGAVRDLLTLWVTASFALWLFPLTTPRNDGRVTTTVAAIAQTFKLPRPVARLAAFVLIALSILVVGMPFAATSAPDQPPLLVALQGSQLISGGSLSAWLAGEGVWFSILLTALGGAFLSIEFFVIGPKLEDAPLSPTEQRDLFVIAIVLWIASAAFVAAALIMPPSGFGPLTKPDAMVLALLALIGLIAWRSALPFVQLALLIGAVFALDGVYQFLSSVWASVHGG